MLIRKFLCCWILWGFVHFSKSLSLLDTCHKYTVCHDIFVWFCVYIGRFECHKLSKSVQFLSHSSTSFNIKKGTSNVQYMLFQTFWWGWSCERSQAVAIPLCAKSVCPLAPWTESIHTAPDLSPADAARLPVNPGLALAANVADFHVSLSLWYPCGGHD